MATEAQYTLDQGEQGSAVLRLSGPYLLSTVGEVDKGLRKLDAQIAEVELRWNVGDEAQRSGRIRHYGARGDARAWPAGCDCVRRARHSRAVLAHKAKNCREHDAPHNWLRCAPCWHTVSAQKR